jgi:hypothetical protein
MGNIFSGLGKYRVLDDGEAYRSYLISRSQPPIVYHSGAMQLKRLRVVGRHARSHIKRFLSFLHNAMVAAKMRRIQRELMFHTGPKWHEESLDKDIRDFPQRPLILSDKWDF